MSQQITVAQDGRGSHTTIQSAINSVRVHPPEPVVIYIKDGIYDEKIVVPDTKPGICLLGESTAGTIITGADHARQMGEDGQELGTFRTPVLTVHADDMTIERLTVRNTAGYGPGIGQALAIYASGDRQVFRDLNLLGNQDTVYLCRGRQYFESCYIEGHVDYIFGSSTAIFDKCELHSLRGGYITAASTPEPNEFGFVFLDCRLTCPGPETSVFLGRPWRPFAHTVFIDTWIGPHVKPEGWSNWGNPDNELTARYSEYGSKGPGAGKAGRVGWARVLSKTEAQTYTIERVLAGNDGWNPGNQG